MCQDSLICYNDKRRFNSVQFSRSVMSDSATPWTVAYQAPPSMEFSKQEYWSGLLFPSPRDLPDPGINQGLLHCRKMLYHLSHQGSLRVL